MENQWATENLQVIRTLMERAALYRRTLAPLMLAAGGIGATAALLALAIPVTGHRAFSLYWMFMSAGTLASTFLQVRRQAWQADEVFWSPPTRRVGLALGPSFFAGLMGGCLWAAFGNGAPLPSSGLAAVWMICYGCGLHAAGFFMVRGIRLFGWIFVFCGWALVFCIFLFSGLRQPAAGHVVMGTFFGILHLAYGLYLNMTEKTV